jgi:hypothetical protein
MRRRDLIAFVGAASALASVAAAQQPKMPTIGVLIVGSPASERFWRLFSRICASSVTSREETFDTNFDRTRGRQAGFPLWLRSWCGSRWN